MPHFDVVHEERRYTCSILLPHATIVASYETERPRHQSLLLRKMSEYELELGRYQDSYQHAIQSYESSVEVDGAQTLETILRKALVAQTLISVGRVGEGRKVLKEANKEQYELYKVCEEDDLEAARISAQNRLNLGQESDAFTIIQQALDRHQACSNKRFVINCLCTQADIVYRQKKYEESEKLYRQVLRISIEIFGENHSESLKYMNTVGNFMAIQGRAAEAAPLFRQACRGREKIYGMEHPLTMESYGGLSSALCSEGNLDEAEVLGRRVFEYSQRYYESNPSLAFSATQALSFILAEQGKPDEQIKLYRKQPLPEYALAAQVSYRASVYLTQGHLLEAEQMLRKYMENLQGRVGEEAEERLDYLLTMEKLVDCLGMQEKWEAAEGYQRQSLKLYEQIHGENSVGAIGYYTYLARTLHKQGKYQPALLILQDILEKTKSHHPDDIANIEHLREACAYTQRFQ